MKKILSLILVLVLMLSIVACGDKNKTPDNNNDEQQGTTDTKVSYVVTVVDTDGNAVEGAVVSFTTKGGSPIPFPTDSEGKASYKTTSVTLKSLKAKKTYYVRVRTYKTVDGKKYYSDWSSKKSKKTK